MEASAVWADLTNAVHALQLDIAEGKVKLIKWERVGPLTEEVEAYEFMTGSGWYATVFMVQDDSPYPTYRWHGTASCDGVMLKLPNDLPHKLWQVVFDENGKQREPS